MNDHGSEGRLESTFGIVISAGKVTVFVSINNAAVSATPQVSSRTWQKFLTEEASEEVACEELSPWPPEKGKQ